MDDASASIRCNFSLEAEPSLLCCTPATDGTHEKERGIFPQQSNHERSINDASTNVVDPSILGILSTVNGCYVEPYPYGYYAPGPYVYAYPRPYVYAYPSRYYIPYYYPY